MKGKQGDVVRTSRQNAAGRREKCLLRAGSDNNKGAFKKGGGNKGPCEPEVGWGEALKRGGGLCVQKISLCLSALKAQFAVKKCSKAIKLFSSCRPPMPMFLVDIRPLSPPFSLRRMRQKRERGIRIRYCSGTSGGGGGGGGRWLWRKPSEGGG